MWFLFVHPAPSGNDLFSSPPHQNGDVPGATIRTSDVTSPRPVSESSDHISSPHGGENLFSSPPHPLPTSEMDMGSSPLHYGTPSSRTGTPGSRAGRYAYSQ